MSVSTDPTTEAGWQQGWQDQITSMDSTEGAMTETLPYIMRFYEWVMDSLVGTMQTLTDVNNGINGISNIFNKGASGSITTEDMTQAMQDANDVTTELTGAGDTIDSGTVDDINDQLDSLFPYGTDPDKMVDYTDSDGNVTTETANQATIDNWTAAWSVSSTDGSTYDADGVQTAGVNAGVLQGYQSNLDDCDNDVSTMDSTVSAKYQMYAGFEDQVGAEVNDLEQDYQEGEETPNTHMASASS